MLAILSLYGLFIEEGTVRQQISAISASMPANVSSIVGDRLTALAETPKNSLGWRLALSALFASYVSYRGTSTLLLALGVIQFSNHDRSRSVGPVTVCLCTAAAVTLVLACLGVLIVVPAISDSIAWVGILRWSAIFLLICGALGLLYSVSRSGSGQTDGTSRDCGTDSAKGTALSRWFSPGAIVGASLWLVGSGLFSIYVSHFARYEVLFGSLAAVAVLMIWLYLTHFVVLLGAVVNTAIVSVRKEAPTDSDQ